MKCLVTGATGFVGAHLVRKLVEAGHQARILRRPQSRTKLLAGLALETCLGDVTDPGSVLEAVRGCEAVFHVAGHVSFWRGHNAIQTRINVGGTRNVVSACLAQGVRRLVHTSSVAAIGFPRDGGLADESLEFNWWPYRINYCNSKFMAEEEVREGVSKGLDAVIVNPGVVFGSGDLNFHAGAIVYQMVQGRIPFYFEGGCCTCDVEDVAQGHLAALEKGRSGERYILGGENLSWRKLFTLIAETVGVPPPSKRIPTWVLSAIARWMELKSLFTKRRPALTLESVRVSSYPVYFTSAKAERELGYRVTPIQDSLRRTYDWYLENRLLQRPDSSATAAS